MLAGVLKCRHEQLGQQKRRGHPDAQHVVEIVIGAAVQSTAGKAGVVYQIVDCAMLAYNPGGKCPEHLFVGDVADKVVVVQDIDGADKSPLGDKRVADGLADTSRSAGDYRNFRFIHVDSPYFRGCRMWWIVPTFFNVDR